MHGAAEQHLNRNHLDMTYPSHALPHDATLLDAESFATEKVAYRLAKVIALETEKERAAIRAALPSDSHLADGLYWYDLLADGDVLGRCATNLELSRPDFLELVIANLIPPNWQTFFWMRAYLRAVPEDQHETMLRKAAALERGALQQENAERARAAGRRSGQARASQARISPREANEAWAALERRGVDKRERAGILAAKFGVTADYVRRVLKKPT